MDGLIETLKGRRAKIASMLNPGMVGSGRDVFASASSLHPQRGFRSIKASFSVTRPGMTTLKQDSITSFSRKTEQKYTEGPNLLHLRPAMAQRSSVSAASASMPLPVPNTQPVAETAAPAPAFPGGGLPAFPPKSERRQVTFEPSDGPSDFEKRLMAAKKQKQHQEAQKRGPDRRKVRTERIEFSSAGASNEADSDLSASGSEPVVQREFREFEKPSNPEIVRRELENGKPQENGNSRQVSASVVQREKAEIPKSEQISADAPGTAKSAVVSGFARSVPVSGHIDSANSSSEESMHSGAEVVQREMEPKAVPVSANLQKHQPMENLDSQTVQREISEKSSPVSAAPVESVKAAPKAAGKPETVQREMAAQLSQVNDSAVLSEPVVPKGPASADTVQREMNSESTAKSAASVKPKAAGTNLPAAKTVQREIRSDSNVKSAVPIKPKHAGSPIPAAETVRREMLSGSDANRVAPGKSETAGTASAAEIVQREMISGSAAKSAVPIRPEPAGVSPADETVRREMISGSAAKSAVPIRPEPVGVSPADETVQREMISGLAAKSAVPGKPEPAGASPAAETVQREMTSGSAVKSAVPGKPEPAGALPAAETVRREMISGSAAKSAVPVKPEPAGGSPAAETVQREMISASASKAPIAKKTGIPVPKPSAPAETIRREMAAKPIPSNTAPEKTGNSIPEAADVSGTIQREITPDHQRSGSGVDLMRAELPVVQRETALVREGAEKPAADTVRREIAVPSEPGRTAPEKAHVPDGTVQREMKPAVLKTGKSVQKSAAPSAKQVKKSSEQKHAPLAGPVRKLAGPLSSAGNSAVPGPADTVQRESVLPLSTGKKAAGASEKQAVSREQMAKEGQPDVVQRDAPEVYDALKAGADPLELLRKGSPVRFEMPKEQDEAIRSGMQQSSPSQTIGTAADTTQRQIMSAAAKPDQPQKKTDFVLPRKKNEKLSKKESSPKGSSDERKRKMPDPLPFGVLPTAKMGSGFAQSSFGQNRPMGNSGGFSGGGLADTGPFSGGLIQREMEDSVPSEQEPEPAQASAQEPSGTDAGDEAEKKIEKILPEVTVAQLDKLADRLVPRIKRIMRAEMERSLFR